MPFVNIKITKEEKASAEDKLKLIQGVTRLLQETLNKDPDMTMVLIEEVETDNWGQGGKSGTQIFAELEAVRSD